MERTIRNQLAQLARKVEGTDVKSVVDALGIPMLL